MDKKINFLAIFVSAIILIVLVSVFSSCTVQLPNLKLPTRSCNANQIDKFRCSDNMMSVEQCMESAGSYYWFPTKNCADYSPSEGTNSVCDYYVGLFTNTEEPECIDGCNYQGYGVALGEYGCFNETTYGECNSQGIKIVDCTVKGCTCYEGFHGTCIGDQEYNNMGKEIQLVYGQSIAEALEWNSLGEQDIPSLLSSERFVDNSGATTNDIPYGQALSFTSGTGILTEAGDGTTNIPDSDSVYFTDNSGEYSAVYELSTYDIIRYDPSDASADLAGASLVIMNRQLTVNSVEVDIEGKITRIIMTDGSIEYNLADGRKARVDGVDKDGTQVAITSNPGEFYGLRITYTPDSDIYLLSGESILEPVFEDFEVKFLGTSDVDGQMIGTVFVGRPQDQNAVIEPVVCEDEPTIAQTVTYIPEEEVRRSGGGSSGGGYIFGSGATEMAEAQGNATPVISGERQEIAEPLMQEQEAQLEEEQVEGTLQVQGSRTTLWVMVILALLAVVMGIIAIKRRKKKA
ncbi:MAG: hypothetical protein KKE20_05080 [Nanoarchaeota archaeon]|nr:hypothetical protein [Nanoarchaeota archaeon]